MGCPDCRKSIGGLRHVETEATTALNYPEADACLSAGKHGLADIEVHLRRMNGQVEVCQVPCDCAAKEARWRISRNIGIPALQLTLAHGCDALPDEAVLSELQDDHGIKEVTLVISPEPPPRRQECSREGIR